LENKHTQATRDLNLSKQVKVKIESSNTYKIEQLTANNAKLNEINADLGNKLTLLEQHKNQIQSKVQKSMED